MAESQLAFEYPAPAESALRASLTDARLRRYLVKGGFNFAYAMRWYLWNARISKAFHYPLHVMEVTLRNAVVHHLQLCGAPDGWPFDTAFIDTLNKASPGIRESLNVAKTNILRARLSADHFHSLPLDRHLDIPRFGTLEADDVIANVSLDFWVRLLGPDFETAWQPHLHRVFPNLQDRSRRDVWKTARHLRDFRNRVAHYRPVFHLADLRETHAAILDTIRLRCPETARWAQHFSTVPTVLAQEPTPNAPSGDGIVPLLRPVAVVPDADVALSEVLPLFAGGKEWVVTARAGHHVAIGCADVVRWLAPSAADGIVELDVSLEAVIDGTVSRRRAAPIAMDSTPGMAATMFYARNVPTKEKPSALVATTDGTMGSEVVGILLKEDLKRQ